MIFHACIRHRGLDGNVAWSIGISIHCGCFKGLFEADIWMLIRRIKYKLTIAGSNRIGPLEISEFLSQRPMCAKENGANLSPTLLVEEWDGQHKYEDCLHPCKLYDGGEKRNTTRTRTTRLAGLGHGRAGRRARGTSMNGPPKSGPSPWRSAAPFCSFYFW
jgi:hypothetical protein